MKIFSDLPLSASALIKTFSNSFMLTPIAIYHMTYHGDRVCNRVDSGASIDSNTIKIGHVLPYISCFLRFAPMYALQQPSHSWAQRPMQYDINRRSAFLSPFRAYSSTPNIVETGWTWRKLCRKLCSTHHQNQRQKEQISDLKTRVSKDRRLQK